MTLQLNEGYVEVLTTGFPLQLAEGYVEVLTYGNPLQLVEGYVEVLTSDQTMPVYPSASRLSVATPAGWEELQTAATIPFAT